MQQSNQIVYEWSFKYALKNAYDLLGESEGSAACEALMHPFLNLFAYYVKFVSILEYSFGVIEKICESKSRNRF